MSKAFSDWTHVYYSKADDKARIDTGIPGYSQIYDVTYISHILFTG